MLYDDPGMLAFQAVEISGGHRGLVAWPTAPIVMGREQLGQLREQVNPSPVDGQILEEARRSAPIHAFVLRGCSDDGRGLWRFDDALGTAEANELSALLFRSHLPLKRGMLELGCVDHIYIDWRRRETAAFESGLRRLRESLRAELSVAPPGSQPARALRRDLWLSDRISFFSGATMTDVLETVLPPRMARREERLTRVRSLLTDEPGT